MQKIIDARIMAAHARTAAAFADWLRGEGGDELAQAVDLLGGPEWSRRAEGLTSALADGDDVFNHLSEIRALRNLLRLERADVLGSLEALLFLSVHPDDPRADNARVCAEAVSRGTAALEALARTRISVAKEVA